MVRVELIFPDLDSIENFLTREKLTEVEIDATECIIKAVLTFKQIAEAYVTYRAHLKSFHPLQEEE